MSELILIRGLPGSGKSTLAKQLCRVHSTDVIYEADLYFMNAYGDYIFDANKLHQAHKWCQSVTKEALEDNCRVIVANTFTTIKELKPYFEIAKEFGIMPIVYHCENRFQSVHDVPEETMERMRARWATDLSALYEGLPLIQ